MRKIICWLLWMSLVGWAWGQPASSNSGTVPTVVRFSGNLVEANGKPLSGVVGVTFSLYKDEQGGAPLWVETQNVPADKSGHYAVTLGSATTQGLPQGIFASGEARWLGVQPQGQAEQPRMLLMSVPYALKAGDAETVGGLPASAFVAASSAGGTSANAGSNLPPVRGGGKPGFIASWKTATQLTNSRLFQNTAGNIGVGTAKPVANFDVNGSAIMRNTLTLFPNGSAPTLTVKGTAFSVSNTGLVSFVSEQTFPGTGTITGVTTAIGSGLTGGGASGTLKLSLTNACSSGQVLSWSGSGWVCSTIGGGGTITGVTAGTDLTGGGTSGNVTLNLDTTKVPQLGTANMFAGTQTVGSGDLAINTGNLDLPQTTGPSSGVLTVGASPFLHACCGSSTFNTFVGSNAGNFKTTGAFNTGTGDQALMNNTVGANNTATGFQALNANDAGSGNTASGYYALALNKSGGSNTAFGESTLTLNVSGLYNTASGAGALNQTTGNSNTGLGNAAGITNTGGTQNTFLGANADAGSSSLTNATAVGASAIVSESNALVLGGTGANAVNVGIGTTTPLSTLDVHGTGNFTGLITFAPNQTFQGAGTITGVNTPAGSGLTGGGTSGTLNLGLTNTCSNGQVLTWNGSAWVCTGLSGGGTITGVTAGTDLTGGGASGNVTLNLDTGKVPQLNANNSFTGNQSVTGNVTASGTVTGGAVNTSTSFSLGGNLFAFGSFGNANAFLGFSGNSGITGGTNTATGYSALSADTNGQSNTADGAYALYLNTGSYNTAAGAYALTMNSTGPSNTASGFGALQFNTTGAGNTASGVFALDDNSTGGFNTASGYQALQSNSTGSYNTATGVQALAANTASGNTASGYQALAANTTATGNTASGYQALHSNTTAAYNTASGYQALYSNTIGFQNAASGYQALYSNANGSSNTASGYWTLYSNTAGVSNTGDGSASLYSNTAGGANTAIGVVALYSNTTGNFNTATGFQALDSNTAGNGNTAVGSFALHSNTTATDNVAIGDAALSNTTTGDHNTAIGHVALEFNLTGDHNTALGANAGPDINSDNLTNTTAIGATAIVSESNALVLGGTGQYAVKVGIGTSAPSNVFTIAQGAGHAISDAWDTYSSRRWKTNIRTLQGSLGAIQRLRGVSFDLKANGKHEIGVIAEEVGKVVPEVVSYEENGQDARGVDYSRLTALLIEATKEQQALIQKQEEQSRTQQKQIKAQQRQIKAQEIQIQTERTRSQARFAQLTSRVNAIQASLKTNSGADIAVRTAAVHEPTVVP